MSAVVYLFAENCSTLRLYEALSYHTLTLHSYTAPKQPFFVV